MALGRWDFMLIDEGIDHAVGKLDLVEVLRAFGLGFAHLRHEANLAWYPELRNPRSFWSDLKVTHYQQSPHLFRVSRIVAIRIL